MREFDLCVIGSGPAGQRAAIAAAKLGQRVCVIEARDVVGGSAINTGTIPSIAGHEMPGQRDLSTPGVRDQITGTLPGRKEQLLRAAYLTSIRNDAQVVNYLARRIVESKGQVPGLQLAAPGAK